MHWRKKQPLKQWCQWQSEAVGCHLSNHWVVCLSPALYKFSSKPQIHSNEEVMLSENQSVSAQLDSLAWEKGWV